MVKDNVRRLRKERELTQIELGQAVGVGQTSIANIESGNQVPSLPLAVKLAEVLGVSLDELVTEIEPA
jgi:DNA-binding XRE family transcriptional regulator